MPLSTTRYLRQLLLTAAGILVFVPVFNYIVDPYDIYNHPKAWDLIRSRPAMNLNLDIHKAHAVERANPDLLLLGSSRVALGFDCTSPDLPANTYNLAIWGTAVYENWRYLQHAASFHMPKVVIFGIDDEFFGSAYPIPPTFSEDRLSVTADGRPNPWSAYTDLSSSLLSPTSLGASLYTVFVPGPVIKDTEGYTSLAQQDGRLRVSTVLAYNARMLGYPHTYYRAKNGATPQLDAFKNIVRFCAANHIRLIVFVNPVHAKLLDVYTSDWADYSDWFHAVVQALNSTPDLNWDLWDFAGYNEITTEAFPPASDVYSNMKNYREVSHYSPAIGAMILDRILAGKDPAGFGVHVTSANVDDDLERISRERAAWHQKIQAPPPPHPAAVAEPTHP